MQRSFTLRPIQFLFGRFVFSGAVLALLFIIEGAHSDSLGACNFPPFSQTIHGPYSFPQVEMIARNHDIGLYQGGRVQLQPWIEVGPNAFLGVDRDGRVLNVIELPERTIAFLLSGQRKIKDIFLMPPADLFALDTDGQILKFDRTMWDKSVLPSIVRRGVRNYAASMCVAGAGAAVYAWYGFALWRPELLMAAGVVSSSSFMLEAFRAMVQFEQQNQITDGFHATGLRIKGFKRAEYEWNEAGQIADYTVVTDSNSISFKQLVNNFVSKSSIQEFADKCEYSLLARGIPPEVYEPKFK